MPRLSSLEILEADLSNSEHNDALVRLINIYARDPLGGGFGLSARSQVHLPRELAKRSHAHVLLAFVDRQPAGLTIAFEGFSTFSCQPVLNIHDVVVDPNYRRRGIAKRMMRRAEDIALELGCCRMTLEVLAGNHTAQRVCRAVGFRHFEVDPAMGKALFWEKKLLLS